ncbi:hypothetical protein [Mycolicibacterium wolinskyi]|uniref:hypothetical protein n=1 Tax=Mycolicibacterium wolinskyi TaxID=59750 RepID=UPI0008357C83|nr:hypothetical protein [Mycolicibacterium wolinskyi]
MTIKGHVDKGVGTSDRLRGLIDVAGPCESIYLDDSRDAADAARARTDILSVLPDRIGSQAVQFPAGPRGGRASESDFADLIDEQLRRLQGSGLAATVEEFAGQKASGSGLAVDGLAAVCAALSDRNVDTLIVGQLGGSTVVTGTDRRVIAADADALSGLGEPVSRVARADEALPFAAIAADASVVSAGDSGHLADGIGALLRYRLKER